MQEEKPQVSVKPADVKETTPLTNHLNESSIVEKSTIIKSASGQEISPVSYTHLDVYKRQADIPLFGFLFNCFY